MGEFKKEFERWLNFEALDEELRKEINNLSDEAEIEDRFYTSLSFGTAGLRGKIGVGTNRMNIYTVAQATKGLCEVIVKEGEEARKMGVAIAHDCRIMSSEFAKLVARIMATYNIKAYLFDDLRPTPELSFAIRHLGCISGINITASHNPKAYNGYKVYWKEGAQIKDNIANQVLAEIQNIEVLSKDEYISFEDGVNNGTIEIIGEKVDRAYYEKVKSVSLNSDVDKDIKIVYTPLNGAGNIAVRTVLREEGYNNVFVVKEQEFPDGTFPTVDYPNPEDQRAFEYAQKLGLEVVADILIATDPDADRLALQIIKDGNVVGFNGNQIGVLLINYILESMKEKGINLEKYAIIKSIVTGDMGAFIAKSYGVKTFEVLTGFKNIADLQNEWDKTGEYKYAFGYEESIGYNPGNFVRDKDAVSSALMLAEAAAYYKKRGKDLKDVLDELFERYGYYAEDTVSITLEGISGKQKIAEIMKAIRTQFPKTIGNSTAVETTDYEILVGENVQTGEKHSIEIEKTNAFKVLYDDESWYTLRPSGTEPKIKLYIYTKAKSLEEAGNKVRDIEKAVRMVMEAV